LLSALLAATSWVLLLLAGALTATALLAWRHRSDYRSSASKMMIGIGTPSSQSNIPRPMMSSLY
jgi:hypothetical protein